MNDRIKELRKSLNLTQQEFANRLNTSRNNIAGYEAGNREPSNAAINNICREFNVNENWLRTGEGDPFIEIDEETRLMQWAGRVLSRQDSDFQHRFVKMLMSLTDEQWLLFEEKVNELASNPDNLRKDDDDN